MGKSKSAVVAVVAQPAASQNGLPSPDGVQTSDHSNTYVIDFLASSQILIQRCLAMGCRVGTKASKTQVYRNKVMAWRYDRYTGYRIV